MSLTFLHWKPLLAIFPGSGFKSFLKSSEVHPNISYMVRKRHTSPNHLVAPVPAGTDVQEHNKRKWPNLRLTDVEWPNFSAKRLNNPKLPWFHANLSNVPSEY